MKIRRCVYTNTTIVAPEQKLLFRSSSKFELRKTSSSSFLSIRVLAAKGVGENHSNTQLNNYSVLLFFFYLFAALLPLPSFPTRRSSDLKTLLLVVHQPVHGIVLVDLRFGSLALISVVTGILFGILEGLHHDTEDRKSTRLNSSHQIISYAVFCLKKKKKKLKKKKKKIKKKKQYTIV